MKSKRNSEELSGNHNTLNPTFSSPFGNMLRHWLSLATEPHILYPVIAVLALSAIWGTTIQQIEVERVTTERTVAVSAHDQADTYEAQVIRSLREIDQTLKFVKYAVGHSSIQIALQELKDGALLPSDLLFEVSIANAKGNVVSSTRPPEKLNVADQDFFQNLLHADELIVSKPHRIARTGETKLVFSRRLDDADGVFSGIVMVSVDADYFVSGYESSQLGNHGMLGILGVDGIFRVRRSGEAVSAGDSTDYAAVLSAMDDEQNESSLRVNSWDDVQRYTSARQLYNFPLIVIVGLSAEEQMVTSRLNAQTYLWRATASSLLLIMIVTVLGHMSRQLALSRQREVDEHIANAAHVEHIAFHDSLTTLPNRSLFSKLLCQSISNASRYNRQLAVMFIDLDNFKTINDTLGHEAGDHLLHEVAARLKTCMRDSDTVARLGGDEFVIMLSELDTEKYVSIVAQRILTALAHPIVLRDHEFRITASIGISTYPQDGLDEQSLTKNADIAMYQAKEAGKNKFRFYSAKMNASSLQRLNLETAMRRALERNEFQLYYQAKRDIRSGRMTGMEALLRWQHSELGTVAPMRFLPLAEETGLIIPIGKWVLHTACQQNVDWQNQGLPSLNMAVNLSERQFTDQHLLKLLNEILSDTGMDPRLLELEISESLLMRDTEKSLKILRGLKKIGVRIAIDHFGIGYSSLATLRKFSLDTIKVDRSFIHDITYDAENKALTNAIITLGKTLSQTVVVQGVETKEQAEYLSNNTCDELQGFYLNMPMPADKIPEILRAQGETAVKRISPATR